MVGVDANANLSVRLVSDGSLVKNITVTYSPATHLDERRRKRQRELLCPSAQTVSCTSVVRTSTPAQRRQRRHLCPHAGRLFETALCIRVLPRQRAAKTGTTTLGPGRLVWRLHHAARRITPRRRQLRRQHKHAGELRDLPVRQWHGDQRGLPHLQRQQDPGVRRHLRQRQRLPRRCRRLLVSRRLVADLRPAQLTTVYTTTRVGVDNGEFWGATGIQESNAQCASPELDVKKLPGTLSGPDASGVFTVTHQIQVVNTSSFAGTYGPLTDQPQYDPNYQVQSASWTGQIEQVQPPALGPSSSRPRRPTSPRARRTPTRSPSR